MGRCIMCEACGLGQLPEGKKGVRREETEGQAGIVPIKSQVRDSLVAAEVSGERCECRF